MLGDEQVALLLELVTTYSTSFRAKRALFLKTFASKVQQFQVGSRARKRIGRRMVQRWSDCIFERTLSHMYTHTHTLTRSMALFMPEHSCVSRRASPALYVHFRPLQRTKSLTPLIALGTVHHNHIQELLVRSYSYGDYTLCALYLRIPMLCLWCHPSFLLRCLEFRV